MTWCHEFDFTTGTHGFASSPGGRAFHVMGSGWKAVSGSFCELIQLQSPTFPTTRIERMTAYFSIAGQPNSEFKARIPNVNATPDVAFVRPASVPSELTINRDAASFWISFDNDRTRQGCNLPYSGFLTRLLVRGAGSNPFLAGFAFPSEEINVLCSSDVVSLCSEARITGIAGVPSAPAACEDYFGVTAVIGREPTYQELLGVLLYTEFDSISDNSDMYPSAQEALARQYYELAGSNGRFGSPEELFEFLGGIEGWYGHHPTQMVSSRVPLSWIIRVAQTRTYVSDPNIPDTEFYRNIVVPRIVAAYDAAANIWNSSTWSGEDWTQGYGDCTQPARWGNVPTGTVSPVLKRVPISSTRDFIIQPAPGC